MKYAFSLSSLEVISVEEFLTLEGDPGKLIGKNSIICDSCGKNIFLKKGEKQKPHFSHYPINKEEEDRIGCINRVGKYSPEYVRKLNQRRSKYRVSYFQQRLEDYIYLALIETLEKQNLRLTFYRPVNYQVSDLPEGLNSIRINCDTNKIFFLDEFRNIYKNRQKSLILDKHLIFFKTIVSDISRGGVENIYKKIIELNSMNQMDKYNLMLGIKDKNTTNEYDRKSVEFASQLIFHLSDDAAEPILQSLFIASAHLYLSTFIYGAIKELKWEETNNGKEEDQDNIFYSRDIIFSILNNDEVDCLSKLICVELVRCIDSCYPKGKQKSQTVWDSFWDYCQAENKLNKSNIDLEKTIASKIVLGMFNIIFSTDLRGMVRSFYGDKTDTVREHLLNYSYNNRGMIYIAYAPWFKDVWAKNLDKKGFKDCVKIGYSVDPERRKEEIAGNMGPPKSIEIEEAWPVWDMKNSESYIFNVLKRFRLDSKREMFGLSVDDARKRVNKIIKEIKKAPSSKNSSKGFG